MPVIDDKETLLIRCKCHGHVLEIFNDTWGMKEEGCIPDFDVSVWNQTPCPMSFWERLKLIWKLVRGKNLGGGDVIIDQSDAMAIANFLTKKVAENHFYLSQRNKTNDKRKLPM